MQRNMNRVDKQEEEISQELEATHRLEDLRAGELKARAQKEKEESGKAQEDTMESLFHSIMKEEKSKKEGLETKLGTQPAPAPVQPAPAPVQP
jgi:hypothetical protein